MILTYWKCKCLDDADCYSLRERTRKVAKERRESGDHGEPERFSQPYKVVIDYADAFDLAYQMLSEGGAEGATPDSALSGSKHEWMTRHNSTPGT